MPQQEVFFEQVTGDRRIQVLKTYDPGYAREVFEEMDDDAQTLLWSRRMTPPTCPLRATRIAPISSGGSSWMLLEKMFD